MVFDAHSTPHQTSSFPGASAEVLLKCATCLKGKITSSAVDGLCKGLKSNTESSNLTAYNDCILARAKERLTEPAKVCETSCKDVTIASGIGGMGMLPVIGAERLYRNVYISAFI